MTEIPKSKAQLKAYIKKQNQLLPKFEQQTPMPLGRRRLRKIQAILERGGVCYMCGYEFNVQNFAAFQFHHVDKSKKERRVRFAGTEKEIQEDMDQCVLVCANCHLIIHSHEEQDA